MARELLLRTLVGMGIGGFITLIFLSIIVQQSIDISVAEVRTHLLGSLFTGVYFCISALMFEIERWSLLKQTIGHFTLSLVVLFPIFTLLTGWVPLQPLALTIGLIIFICIYALCWLGWYMYYKRLERKMNETIHKK